MTTLILTCNTDNQNDISHMLRELAERIDCGTTPQLIVIDQGFDEKEMSVEIEVDEEEEYEEEEEGETYQEQVRRDFYEGITK